MTQPTLLRVGKMPKSFQSERNLVMHVKLTDNFANLLKTLSADDTSKVDGKLIIEPGIKCGSIVLGAGDKCGFRIESNRGPPTQLLMMHAGKSSAGKIGSDLCYDLPPLQQAKIVISVGENAFLPVDWQNSESRVRLRSDKSLYKTVNFYSNCIPPEDRPILEAIFKKFDIPQPPPKYRNRTEQLIAESRGAADATTDVTKYVVENSEQRAELVVKFNELRNNYVPMFERMAALQKELLKFINLANDHPESTEELITFMRTKAECAELSEMRSELAQIQRNLCAIRAAIHLYDINLE